MLKEGLHYLLGLSGYTAVEPGQKPLASKVVAAHREVSLRSLEEFQERPNRIKHSAMLASSKAFCDYVLRFKEPDTSIYLDLVSEEPGFTAVLDHHGFEKPNWQRHVAVFTPRFSLEWQAWKELHEAGGITQETLVQFFEDHVDDCFDPAPSAILTRLKTFEAVEKHTYQSAMSLENGNIKLTYVKDGGQRSVEFPHKLRLALPVLENEKAVPLDAKLRYRTAEGSIRFFFQFTHDPRRVERDQLRALASAIQTTCAGVACYEGAVGGKAHPF